MSDRTSWPWGEPEGWTELPAYPGGDFLIRRTVQGEDRKPAGFILAHLHPDGEWCVGSVSRRGFGDGQAEWDVLSEDPLTLSPSVLRQDCGLHGWIQNGVWVGA